MSRVSKESRKLHEHEDCRTTEKTVVELVTDFIDEHAPDGNVLITSFDETIPEDVLDAVGDDITVYTGSMRPLPFGECFFDAVIGFQGPAMIFDRVKGFHPLTEMADVNGKIMSVVTVPYNKAPWVPLTRTKGSLDEIILSVGEVREMSESAELGQFKMPPVVSTWDRTDGTQMRLSDHSVAKESGRTMPTNTQETSEQSTFADIVSDGGESSIFHHPDHELNTQWVWTDAFTRWVKNRLEGRSLKVCCGLTPLADVNVDIDPEKAEPDMVADMYNLPFDEDFETTVSDTPWIEIPLEDRPHLFRECIDATKPAGKVMYNTRWVPDSPLVENQGVRFRQEDDFGGNTSILTTSRKYGKAWLSLEVDDCKKHDHEMDHLTRYHKVQKPAESTDDGRKFANINPEIVDGSDTNHCCRMCGYSGLEWVDNSSRANTNGDSVVYECQNPQCEFLNTEEEILSNADVRGPAEEDAIERGAFTDEGEFDALPSRTPNDYSRPEWVAEELSEADDRDGENDKYSNRVMCEELRRQTRQTTLFEYETSEFEMEPPTVDIDSTSVYSVENTTSSASFSASAD